MSLRFAVASDLHAGTPGAGPLRLSVSPHNLGSADVVILAGDVCGSPGLFPETLNWVRRFSSTPIVAVLGNGEWYDQVFPDALSAYRKEASRVPDVHLLEQEHWDFRGVRFLGCTLWTDFARGQHAAYCETNLRLFQRVRDGGTGRLLRVSRIEQAHQASQAWLGQHFPAKTPTVVVTHHAPSPQSEDPRFREKPGSCAYWVGLGTQIREWRPTLWVHGHIHIPVDYWLHGTRIFSNPWGYQNERAGCLSFRLVELLN